MKLFPCTGKRPLLSNGFKGASDDEAVIAEWERAYPGCNWGAPTGRENGFVVLDFDKKSGGLESLELLRPQLPPTLVVRTQNEGYHFYFEAPAVETQNKQRLQPGVDYRGDGGYVLVVPSQAYEVVEDVAMAPLPDWLLQLVRPVVATQPVLPNTGGALLEGSRGNLNKRTLRFIAEGALPGAWHAEYFQAGMNLQQNGYSFEEAQALLTKATGVLDDVHDLPTLRDIYTKRVPKYGPDLSSGPYTPDLTGNSVMAGSGNDIPEPARYRETELTAPSTIKASDLVSSMMSYLKDKSKVKGEPTGIPELDHLLGGGKRFGEVTVTLAEAKSGKNTLWHKLMHLWLNRGIPLGYASRELSPEDEVLPNLLSLEYQQNFWKKENYDDALIAAKVGTWPLFFAGGYGAILEEELLAWMDHCRTLGVRYFWIDHLHYCLADPEDFKGISKFIRQVKSYAKRWSVHVDIIVQPKIQETGSRLSLNSLRGGASIGQALDNLLTMTRERDGEGSLIDVVLVRLEVARSKLARLGKFHLGYNKDTTDFEVVVQEEAPSAPEGGNESDLPVFDQTRAGRGMGPKLLA